MCVPCINHATIFRGLFAQFQEERQHTMSHKFRTQYPGHASLTLLSCSSRSGTEEQPRIVAINIFLSKRGFHWGYVNYIEDTNKQIQHIHKSFSVSSDIPRYIGFWSTTSTKGGICQGQRSFWICCNQIRIKTDYYVISWNKYIQHYDSFNRHIPRRFSRQRFCASLDNK